MTDPREVRMTTTSIPDDTWTEISYGRDVERGEVVRWLRAQNDPRYPPVDDTTRGTWNAYSAAANAIERGDHLSAAGRAATLRARSA